MSDEKTFSPRLEAHAMKLNRMLGPVQKATRDLLDRIHGALTSAFPEESMAPNAFSEESKAHQKEPATSAANCFLVTGERGTGKTTVLLSAQKLVQSSQDEDSAKIPEDIRRWVKEIAERAEWLDVLDVEPLPPKTNLLTVLLVRIRNAIAPRAEGRHGESRASIFEERADSAHERLNKLIQDAALIWEDIHESSTRDRIERQVAAAETFSRFKHDFDKTFARIADERAKEKGEEKRKAFVLPIDNIDRSPEHLHSIFKLAQMVSSKHLWLVLAGDRVDLNTLLERVYWKELFQTSVGTVAGAKEHRGEDESLSIARRQAAATIRKILPPNHRIEVKLVEPNEALTFKLPGEDNKLLDLLRKIYVFNADTTAQSGLGMTERTNLADLLTRNDFLEEPHDKQDSSKQRHLLPHGWDALRLPARTLLDLTQLVQQESSKLDKKHSAAYIARSMYRLAIAESTLPEWLTEELQERFVQRSRDYTTIHADQLDSSLFLVRVRQPTYKVPGSGRRSRIHLMNSQGALLKVELKDKSLEYLPAIASGWLLVLYDMLMTTPRPLVFFNNEWLSANAGEHVNVFWRFPSTKGIDEILLRWPYPKWRTLFEMGVASDAWRLVLNRVKHWSELDSAQLRKFLAIVWIDIACWLGEEENEHWLGPVAELFKAYKANPTEIDEIERQTLARAAKLLKDLNEKAGKSAGPLRGSDWRDVVAHEWLRLDLPLLFMPELETGLTLESNEAKLLLDLWENDVEEINAHRAERLYKAMSRAGVREIEQNRIIDYFNARTQDPFKIELLSPSAHSDNKAKEA